MSKNVNMHLSVAAIQVRICARPRRASATARHAHVLEEELPLFRGRQARYVPQEEPPLFRGPPRPPCLPLAAHDLLLRAPLVRAVRDEQLRARRGLPAGTARWAPRGSHKRAASSVLHCVPRRCARAPRAALYGGLRVALTRSAASSVLHCVPRRCASPILPGEALHRVGFSGRSPKKRWFYWAKP